MIPKRHIEVAVVAWRPTSAPVDFEPEIDIQRLPLDAHALGWQPEIVWKHAVPIFEEGPKAIQLACVIGTERCMTAIKTNPSLARIKQYLANKLEREMRAKKKVDVTVMDDQEFDRITYS